MYDEYVYVEINAGGSSVELSPDQLEAYDKERRNRPHMGFRTESIMASGEKCKNCGGDVTVMAMKGTGICGENCRKEYTGEVSKPGAQTDAGITNLLNQPNGKVDPRGIR